MKNSRSSHNRRFVPANTRRRLIVESLESRNLLSTVTPGVEQRVNSFLANEQREVDIAMDAVGNSVVVWTSEFQDSDFLGIYGQRFDSSGVKLGEEFKVSNDLDYAYSPEVAVAPGGVFVVVFGSNDQVFGQRFDAEGGLIGGNFQIDDDPEIGNDYARGADVAIDASGNFVVAWANEDFLATDSNQVHWKRYDSSGNPIGDLERTNAGGSVTSASVSTTPDGRSVIAYSSLTTASGASVFAQPLDASGTRVGDPIRVDTFADSSKYTVDSAMDEAGNFTIVWDSFGQDGDLNGVFGQRANVSGAKLGSEFQLNTNTATAQERPSIAMDHEGNFLVTWQSSHDTIDVYAQRYSANGVPAGEEFHVGESLAGDKFSPAVAMDPGGDFVIAWEASMLGAPDSDIYFRPFEENNAPIADAGRFYSASEGQVITLNAGASYDGDNDPLQYRWDFESDGTWDTEFSDSPEVTHAWNDDFVGNLTIEVTDAQSSVTAQAPVNIANVAPTLQVADGFTGSEGMAVALQVNVIDPGVADTHSYAWDFGDGSASIDAPSLMHTYADDGDYDVIVTVTDDDDGTTTEAFVLTVLNAPPTINLVTHTGPIAAREDVTVTVDATDVAADSLQYRFDFDNDGLFEQSNNVGNATHTFAGANIYPVSVQVSDEEGGVTQGWTAIEVGDASMVVPVVEFANASQTAVEDAGVISVSVILDQAVPTHNVVVPVSLSGTASSRDYRLEDPIVVIPPGETTGSFQIELTNDLSDEYSESIVMELGDAFYAILGAQLTHTVTIEDDDLPPVVSFSRSSQAVSENTGHAEVVAKVSAISEKEVVIPLEFLGSVSDADFTTSDTSITIPAGSARASKLLQIVDDELIELTETLTVVMLEPDNGRLSDSSAVSNTHTLLISDNDLPTVAFTAVNRRVLESAGTVNVTAILSMPSDHEVSVSLTVAGTANEQDFQVLPTSQLVFEPGVTEVTVSIDLLDDALAEPDESVLLLLGEPVNAVAGQTNRCLLTIRDDDIPSVSFTTSSANVFEDESAIIVDATLSNVSTTDIVVDLSYGGTATKQGGWFFSSSKDYEVSTSTLVFPAGETTASLTLTPIDDELSEGVESVAVSMNRPANANLGSLSVFQLALGDDDPIVSFAGESLTEIKESYGTLPIEISLSSPSNKDVTAHFSKSGGATEGEEYTLSDSSFVVIPAGSTTAVIQATIIDDEIPETPDPNDTFDFGSIFYSSPSFTLTLDSAENATLPESSGFGWFSGFFGNRAVEEGLERRVVIRDDDDHLPIVGFSGVSHSSIAEGSVSLFGHSIGVEISRAFDEPVTVTLEFSGTATRNRDYAVASTIVIPTGRTTASTELFIHDDSRREPTEQITATIGSVTNARFPDNILRGRRSPSTTIHITDNDESATVVRPAGIAPVGTLAISTDSISTSYPPLGTLQASPSVPVDYLSPTGTLALPLGGILSGSTAYFDSNRNGVHDFLDLNGNGLQDPNEPDEFSTTTASDGLFNITLGEAFDLNSNGSIDLNEGQIVVVDGIDSATLLPIPLPLVAPAGSVAISAMTTLMSGLIDRDPLTLEQSRDRVISAFKLPSIPLETINVVADITAGNQDAMAILVANSQVENTVAQIATSFSVLPNVPPRKLIAEVVMQDIVDKIAEPFSELDLAETSVVGSLIDGTLKRIGTQIDTDTVDNAAFIIASGNQYLQSISDTADPGLIIEVAGVQKVAQGFVATRLANILTDPTLIPTVVQETTGQALVDLVSVAEVGDPLPPTIVVTDGLQIEGNAGEQLLEFTVAVDPPSALPISVDYETQDFIATVDNGDYVAVSGTLEWDAGDATSRTIRVAVLSDADFEQDEPFVMWLSNSRNAAIRRDLAYGLIVNDDGYSHSVTANANPNYVALRSSGEVISLVENEDVIYNGVLNIDLPITLSSPDNPASGIVFAMDLTVLDANEQRTVVVQMGKGDSMLFNEQSQWRMGEPVVEDTRFLRSAVSPGATILVDGPYDWQNVIQVCDVTNEGSVTALDALRVINELNSPAYHDRATAQLFDASTIAIWPGNYYDVTGDGNITALDALRVINQLARISTTVEAESQEMNRLTSDQTLASFSHSQNVELSFVRETGQRGSAEMSTTVLMGTERTTSIQASRVTSAEISSQETSTSSGNDDLRRSRVPVDQLLSDKDFVGELVTVVEEWSNSL